MTSMNKIWLKIESSGLLTYLKEKMPNKKYIQDLNVNAYTNPVHELNLKSIYFLAINIYFFLELL